MHPESLLFLIAACVVALSGTACVALLLRVPLKILALQCDVSELQARLDTMTSQLARAVRRWGREEKKKTPPSQEESLDALEPGVGPDGEPIRAEPPATPAEGGSLAELYRIRNSVVRRGRGR